MMWGVRIRALKDNHETDYWFDTLDSRETFIKRFSKDHFMIVEYLNEQLELLFDIR